MKFPVVFCVWIDTKMAFDLLMNSNQFNKFNKKKKQKQVAICKFARKVSKIPKSEPR